MDNESTQLLNNNENQELTPKKEWKAPELFKIATDETLITANPGFDGVTVS